MKTNPYKIIVSLETSEVTLKILEPNQDQIQEMNFDQYKTTAENLDILLLFLKNNKLKLSTDQISIQ